MSDAIWRIVAGVLVLAILFVLVRPGSQAGQAVKDLGGAAVKLVQGVVQ